MKYFSMFSGIGGFEYGIQKATDWKCIGYSEIDRYAKAIYRRHFPTYKDFGNATRIKTNELPDFGILVGGFPCQSFSIAGKRKGFNDTRGTLFFEIARILKDKRPRYFLLENVKGLLSHDKGKTFQTILEVLTNLGYIVEWQVLNSKNFGVPQNRERVFFIGYIRGTSGPKVFPITENDKENFKLYGQQVGAITTRRGTAQSDGDYVVKSRRETLQKITKNATQGYRVYDSNGIAKTLASNAGGIGAKTGLYAMRTRGNGQVLEKRKDGNTNALTSVTKDNLWYTGYKIRRLTPMECERLQGFPDKWTKWGIDEKGKEIKISDTQRYKTLGNAVTTNVVEFIIRKFIKEK